MFLISPEKMLCCCCQREGNFNGIIMSDSSGQYAAIDQQHDDEADKLLHRQYLSLFLSYPVCIQQCPLNSHSSKSMSAIPSNATCLIIKYIIVCLSGSSKEDMDVPTFRQTHSFSILQQSVQFSTDLHLGYIKKKGEQFVKRFCWGHSYSPSASSAAS